MFQTSGIIGYAPEFYEIVTSSDIEDKDDDQLFYTKVFLDEKLRVRILHCEDKNAMSIINQLVFKYYLEFNIIIVYNIVAEKTLIKAGHKRRDISKS